MVTPSSVKRAKLQRNTTETSEEKFHVQKFNSSQSIIKLRTNTDFVLIFLSLMIVQCSAVQIDAVRVVEKYGIV